MKLRLTFLLIVFSIINGFCQTNPGDFLPKNILKELKTPSFNIFGVDSIYCFKFNETAGAIIEHQRTYNLEVTPNGLVVRELTENFENGVWVKNRLLENDYLPSQEVGEQLIQTWNQTANDWQGSERRTFQYNSDNLLTSLLLERFNTQTGTWEFVNRSLFKYFNLPEPDEFLLQDWNGTTWVNNGQIFFSYNSNLQITSSIFRIWDTSNNQWVNANQTFETYDSDFMQIRTERETWNQAFGDWDNSTRAEYFYNQQSELDRVANEIWVNQDSTWAFTDDNLYRYDFRNRNNEFITRNFNGTDFENFFRNKRTFDINDNIKKVENQFFQGGFWVNDNFCDLFYSELQISDTEDITTENQCKIIKTDNAFSIECADFIRSHDQIYFEVHDMNGKKLFSKKITPTEKISPFLPDGIYLLSFKTNQRIIASQKEYISK